MGEINLLPKNVAELIAAGEVIERPSSVIKELVENSIDACAKSITVEIQHGGITFMRVTDDGKGIRSEDVRTAFLRHATSKILKSDDLDSISTLGFRGEALASICAVSRVEMLTKSISEENGVKIELDGGEEKSFQEAGCPQGTTFIVRDLFYNVPARMKFLKKDVSEGNAVSGLIDRIALSHPEISFTFIRDGRRALKTPGDGILENAIFQVYGEEISNSMLPIEYSLGGISLKGFITKPQSSNRSNRTMQIFYINGRYVRTKTGIAAVEQAYQGYIMTGKYPSCVIFLEMDYTSLDVNVHPAKLEVRFENERPVYDVIYHAVRSAVVKYDPRNEIENSIHKPQITNPKLLSPKTDKGVQLSFSYEKNNIKNNSQTPVKKPTGNVSDLSKYFDFEKNPEKDNEVKKDDNLQNFKTAAEMDIGNDNREDCGKDNKIHDEKNIEISSEENSERNFQKEMEISAENDITENIEEENTEEIKIIDEDKRAVRIKYIGEAFNTYILLEYGDDRVMFIDKHAAHERLIYENLKEQYKNHAPQILLQPIIVTLDREEASEIIENRTELFNIGFEVDSFGDGKIAIRSVPMIMENIDIEESFCEIADYLYKHKKIALSEKMEWIYANTACRAAIKGGNVNSPEELINIALTLENNPQIRTCPHGRPIYFFMTKKEIEKSFKRIV